MTCQGHSGSKVAIYKRLERVEDLLLKAARSDEITRIAAIENRLRKLMRGTWMARVKKAVDKTLPMFEKDASLGDIMEVVDGIFGDWSDEVLDTYLEGVEQTYKLARDAGFKKASGKMKRSLQYNQEEAAAEKEDVQKAKATAKPVLGVKDKKAIEALRRHETFWIGDLYGTRVQRAIRGASKEVLEAGGAGEMGRDKLREKLERVMERVESPEGYVGTASSYLEGVVNNAVTVSRVQGQLRSFEELNIQQYVIVNPIDERTCEVCSHMDGKTFSVSKGIQAVEEEVDAKTPDDVADIHPWLNPEKLLDISPKAGDSGASDSDALMAEGFSMPPFHLNCRCTVDMV